MVKAIVLLGCAFCLIRDLGIIEGGREGWLRRASCLALIMDSICQTGASREELVVSVWEEAFFDSVFCTRNLLFLPWR